MLAISFYPCGKEVWGKLSDVTKVRQESKKPVFKPSLVSCFPPGSKILENNARWDQELWECLFPQSSAFGNSPAPRDHENLCQLTAAYPSCEIWAEQ